MFLNILTYFIILLATGTFFRNIFLFFRRKNASKCAGCSSGNCKFARNNRSVNSPYSTWNSKTVPGFGRTINSIN